MLSILIIDNSDSFTYNLVETIRQTGLAKVQVCLLEDIANINIQLFDGYILSPGPGLPREKKGLSELIESIQEKPLLGVCLGHQAIAEYFGAKIYQLNNIIHGESSSITVDNRHEIYRGFDAKIEVGRYHSWAVDSKTLPDCFELGAMCCQNVIMGLKHKKLNIYTVQYHPESILTPLGSRIIANWLEYCVK